MIRRFPSPAWAILAVATLVAGNARGQIPSDLADGAPKPDPSGRHRMAIVVSSSIGRAGQPALPGVRPDADAMAEVFLELGGVASGDLIRLVDPDSAALVAGFERARMSAARDSAAGVPSELVFYHAGHAEASGLRLGRTCISWEHLRNAMARTGAKVRIGILDACASGALLRVRGGHFVLPAPAPFQGEAWMVSSRAEEVSVETDSDGGGIFTRILLAGLRGGADRDHDGEVTFDEAFHHVAEATRARAKSLGVASQSPQWSSSLEGDRPLVLTRTKGSGSSVHLPVLAEGILLTDSAGKGEAWIPPDTAASTIFLPQGLHTAWVDDGRVRRGNRFRLGQFQSRQILSEEFLPIDSLPALAKPDTSLVSVPVNFGLLSPLTMNGDRPEHALNHFSFDLVLGDAGSVTGFQTAGILTRVRHDVVGAQISTIANLTGRDVVGFQLGTVNLLGGGVTGAQWGWALNLDEGISRGIQVAGLMNVNRDSLRGVQLALASSYAGTLHGAQISLVNVAGTMTGTQIGLLNIARESHGLQAGLLNISLRSNGAAVGLVNILPHSNTLAPGAIDIGQDLSAHPVVGVATDGSFDLQLRYGTRWWRSLVIAESPSATDWTAADAERWGIGIGTSTGQELSLGVDLLALSSSLVPHSVDFGLQADLEWNILPRLAPGLLVRWTPASRDDLKMLATLAF